MNDVRDVAATDVGVRLDWVRLEEVEALGALMRPVDVWRNLEFPNPPSSLLLRIALKRGDFRAIFLRRTDDERIIGFVLLYGPVGPDHDVEFDIAVTQQTDRRLGLARKSIFAFERFMFEQGLARALWAFIDEANRPCLELVRTCNWPVTRTVPEGLVFVDGPVTAVEVRLERSEWEDFVRRRSEADRARVEQAHSWMPRGGKL